MFAADDDEEYFGLLRQFANLVHERVVGGPYAFPTQAANDAAGAIGALANDIARRFA
jgi:hypothetical protein